MKKTILFSLLLFSIISPVKAQIYTPSGTIQGASGGNNVGIGTSTPNTRVNIEAPGAGIPVDALTVSNSFLTANTETGIFFAPTNAGGGLRGARISAINDGSNNISLKFYTGVGGTITEKMRINNIGNVGIGTTPPANQTFTLSNTITGSTVAVGIMNQGIVQPDVTSTVYYNRTNAGTQAAAFTLNTLVHHSAVQGTFGAGSTVTNQYGFNASSTLIGATNNFGFRGDIPSGANNWNCYMPGTANNYFNGNTGFGTVSPFTRVDISSTTAGTLVDAITIQNAGGTVNTETGIFFAPAATAGNIRGARISAINDGSNNISLRFFTGSGSTITEKMRINALGNIGIGSTSPDSKLTVKGKIHAEEVKVDLAVPADYVFEKYYLGDSSLKPDYTLLTLFEIEKFTKENHHLPNVPSAKEIKENGLLLGEMSNILLQKIEELTLYSIEQQKENNLQSKEIELQSKEIETLKKENESFKKLEDRLARLEKESVIKK